MRVLFAAAMIFQGLWVLELRGQTVDPAAEEFGRLQAIYTNSLGAIESRYFEKAKAQPSLFLQELEKLGLGYQQKGDLKGVIAVKEERQRFQGELGSLNVDVAGEPKELETLKARFKGVSADLESKKAKELSDLNVAYLNRLTAYLRQLTVQGKIDLAVAVQGEADRIQALVQQTAKKAPEPRQQDAAGAVSEAAAEPAGGGADSAQHSAAGAGKQGMTESGADAKAALSPISAKRRVYLADLAETSSQVGGQHFMKGRLDTWAVNGDTPMKGIFAHAPSVVTYEIGGLGMTTLEGEVGLGRVNPNSSVQFKIYGDSQLLWRSGVIKQGPKAGESMTEKYSVKVRNVRKLLLEVDDLKDRNSDHSIWIDPRLTK